MLLSLSEVHFKGEHEELYGSCHDVYKWAQANMRNKANYWRYLCAGDLGTCIFSVYLTLLRAWSWICIFSYLLPCIKSLLVLRYYICTIWCSERWLWVNCAEKGFNLQHNHSHDEIIKTMSRIPQTNRLRSTLLSVVWLGNYALAFIGHDVTTYISLIKCPAKSKNLTQITWNPYYDSQIF